MSALGERHQPVRQHHRRLGGVGAQGGGQVRELGGVKSLYSSSYYNEEAFWNIYDRPRYLELKRKYDPGGVFPGLYAKCVRNQ
jgi:hypothetical protein